MKHSSRVKCTVREATEDDDWEVARNIAADATDPTAINTPDASPSSWKMETGLGVMRCQPALEVSQ